MPTVTYTIDNVNPLISYQPSGDWGEGSLIVDPEGSEYFDETFSTSITSGSSASFSFNGTSITIGGAKRSNHGPYNVTMDGLLFQGDGFAEPDMVQTSLYTATNLKQGPHKVVITNAETNSSFAFLDIDFITWESEIGQENEILTNVTVQDTDPNFSYQPVAAWTTNPGNLSSFNGLTGHSTATAGAFVQYSFEGDAVALFGTVGPHNAPYSVQLDGRNISSFNGTKQAFTAQVSLFQADKLGPGIHTLKVVNEPSSSGQSLNIDFATVLTVPSVNGNSSVTSVPSINNGATTKHSRLGAGIIVAVVLAVLSVLAAVFTLVFFVRRRKHARRISLTLARSIESANIDREPKPPLDFPMASLYAPSTSPDSTQTAFITSPNIGPVLSYARSDYGYQVAQRQIEVKIPGNRSSPAVTNHTSPTDTISSDSLYTSPSMPREKSNLPVTSPARTVDVGQGSQQPGERLDPETQDTDGHGGLAPPDYFQATQGHTR